MLEGRGLIFTPEPGQKAEGTEKVTGNASFHEDSQFEEVRLF